MNLKKILAGVVAGAMALSAMAVGSFAEAESDLILNDSGEKELEASEWGSITVGQYATELCGGTYEFSADDVITATLTAQEGVDTSEWQIAFLGFNGDWNGWQGVYGEKGELTCTATIGDVMEKNSIEDIADLGGFAFQVANVGEEGDKVAVSYEITVAPKADDPTEEGLETALYVGNSVDWNTVKSDSVNIAIGNEYTYSISGLDIAPDKLTVIYIKDVAVENKEAEKSDIDPVKVTFTSVKINGNEVAVKEGVPTGLNDSGAFDIALFNIWGDSFIDLPEENINSVEIAIKLEAADEEPEPTPAESTEEETTANALDPDNDNASASSSNPENQPTGIAIAIVPAVLAAAGVVISKKRK